MSILVETPRLLIKTPILDDLEYWYVLHSDEDVMEYMGGVQRKSVVQEWLQSDILHHISMVSPWVLFSRKTIMNS
ncbi:GNAT family N-acetyltransferase [Legionella pneumophila serogroup 7]|nr:GNAT family N-acetyltransferase [Legionella pneumophila]MDW9167036.1 GNAT family N-acetyltransferase [Legionella pneumophila subsp. fraseri]MDX1846915.1 GNAT family N-acetyltransferase [Legionella pneumophila subsp. fraseri]